MINRELQPLDEIRERRRMHLMDDKDNLSGREAIKNSMTPQEKNVIFEIIMQNASDKNRSLWKPTKLEVSPIMRDIFKKYESEQIELPP